MNPSLFLSLVNTYFPGLVLRVVEKYNGENSPFSYSYRKFLRTVFSADGKWSTISGNNSLVAADIVALDSPLPLKKRASMGAYSGDIPKMGQEMSLNEKELTDLQSLVARMNFNGSATVAQIVAKLFRDTDSVIGAIYERLEAMFLEGLSTGATVVEDTENVGLGVRLDYRYPTANLLGATVSWDDVTNAKPITDLRKMLRKAKDDGNTVVTILMDDTTYDQLAASKEARQLYATSLGITSSTDVPVPTQEQLNSALQKNYKFTVQIIDRSIRIQRNGVNVSYRPWKAGSVVGLPVDGVIGSLTYARLAEQDYPAPGVVYQLADEFILLSKFNENRPTLREVTNSQARVVPVIDNVDGIYVLDTTIDNG